MKKVLSKKRVNYIIAVFLSIATGLFVRSSWVNFPEIIDEYIGDIIWGGMVYFLFASIVIHQPTKTKILLAMIFSFTIEFSQLLQYDWLNKVRQFKLAGLVLGYGYKTSDLVCYTAGIAIAVLLDKIIISKR